MSIHFGTNGVRGLFEELTPALALSLSQSIGTYSGKGKVLIARDARLTGPILRDAVASGLASVGCDVVDLGMVSSPTAEFMVRKLEAAGLIIISASHNPPEWNALKVIDGKGVSISKERGAEIERTLGKAPLAPWDSVKAPSLRPDPVGEHIEAILEQVDGKAIRERKPRIVLDCGNGATCEIAERLFISLGCQVLSINSHPDGRFPGRPSEPTEANVKELIALVKSSKSDAGIAWDGDGDRVIFVDEEGSYVIGDKVLALCLLWKISKGGRGDVVTTVATSKAVEDVAKAAMCRVRYTAIGAPYLSEEMARGKALIGGEEVGGVIFPEMSLAKDGLLTGAKLAEALCRKPLSEWLEAIPTYHNVKRKVEADEKGKKAIVARARDHARKEGLRMMDVDGVRIDFDEAWVIVRASGTEPYVRVFAEARSRKGAEKLCSEWVAIAEGR